MAQSLRILFVAVRSFPYLGGVETHTYEVSRRLAALGNDVTVLSTDPSGRLKGEEQSERVRILRVRSWPRNRDYYFAPGIYRTIRHGRWDLVHCQGYHSLVAPLAMLAALRANLPYIVTFHSAGHSSRTRNALRGMQQTMLRPLLSRAERLVGVSNFEVELFRERLRLPPDRFVVIPTGCGLPEVGGTAAEQSSGPLIVSAGRLERYKGHHRILAALPAILKHRPDVRLRIVGSGPFEGELCRLATRLRVADRVEIGSISGTDRKGMAELLSRAALVTLLSDYEGQPAVVLEALAMRRPALVTHTSGLAELADRGLVRSIPLQSTPEQVAEAVLFNLRHPLVPANIALPSWEDCVADLLTLYRSVINRSGRSVSVLS